jgi:hypothetical protein
LGLSREHHRYVDVAGQMGQPFGMSGVGKSGEVKRVLVSGRGDDGVDLALEGQSDRSLD